VGADPIFLIPMGLFAQSSDTRARMSERDPALLGVAGKDQLDTLRTLVFSGAITSSATAGFGADGSS
jgi:hypothetical protein